MGKRRVISLLMAFLLAASLLPSTAIQALASGGTVDDWCGVNDPANTLNLSLNNGNQAKIIKQVADAGYNDTVTINVSGTVMLKEQLYNDKGATIHLKGVGSGACIKPVFQCYRNGHLENEELSVVLYRQPDLPERRRCCKHKR